MKHEITYCDNCGDPVYQTGGAAHDPRSGWEGTLKPYRVFSELPFDVESANKGESGVVCNDCISLKSKE